MTDSSDLVERLRAIDLMHMNGLSRALNYRETIDEAADTIQRLESANTELRIRYANAQAKIGRMEDRIQQVGS
jgi:hypothetical protein